MSNNSEDGEKKKKGQDCGEVLLQPLDSSRMFTFVSWQRAQKKIVFLFRVCCIHASPHREVAVLEQVVVGKYDKKKESDTSDTG